MTSSFVLNSHMHTPVELPAYTEGRFDIINVNMTGQSSFYPMTVWETGNPIHLYNENIDVTGGYATYAGQHSGDPQPSITADSVYSVASRVSYIMSPTFLLQDIGNTPTTRGTSQYVFDTYPVPTVNRREVGTGKTYSTVLDAYLAADEGDNIVIFPGTYDCSDFRSSQTANKIVKNVRFYGSTQTHTDVTLTGSCGTDWWFQIYPYRMKAVGGLRPGFYHLSVSRNLENWRHNFTIHSTVA